MQTVGVLQLLALTGLAGLGIGALLAAGVVYLFGGSWSELELEVRLRRIRFWAFVPFVAGLLAVGVAALPSVLDAVGLVADHCHSHPDHHFHLCFVHASHLHPTTAGWVALAAGAVVPAAATGRTLVGIVRGEWRMRELVDGARRIGRRMYAVSSDRPFACTCDLTSPKVVVSTALLDRTSQSHLSVVRAHERTHVERGHLVWDGLLRLATSLHLPGTGRWLRSEAALAREQICDREAARRTGGEEHVARALVAVERIAGSPRCSTDGVTSRVDGPDLERRVRALLDESPRRRGGTAHAVTCGLFATLFVLNYESIHHLLETVFAYVHGTFH